MRRGITRFNNSNNRNCQSLCDPVPLNSTLEQCCRKHGCVVANDGSGDCMSPPGPGGNTPFNPQPNIPDNCPAYYFDQDGVANFTGSCNDNMLGGYKVCCMCGGQYGGYGECPNGCYDKGGECVPNTENIPSSNTLPKVRGCYSKDIEGNYFLMGNDATHCGPANIWVDGNGSNHSPPSPPRPPSPSVSTDCPDGQVKSLQTGKCFKITNDTKWTKDVYNSMLVDMMDSNAALSKDVCTCVLSNMTKKYSPIETNAEDNMDAIAKLVMGCNNQTIKAVTPQLYTTTGTGKPDNTKKILLIVCISLLVLILLVYGGVMIYEHNKK